MVFPPHWNLKQSVYPIFTGIVILGAALRLVNLGAEPFWADEVLSLDIARHFASISQMLQYLREVEIHPPLYYLLLHRWVRWFGESEFIVRLPSLLFGLAMIPAVYALAMKIFEDRKAALIAAFLTAVLPLQIEFSQEARPYIIFCFWGTISALALWQYLKTSSAFFIALYCLANVIGLYLHYSYGFVTIALASWWLLDMAGNTPTLRRFNIFLGTHTLIALGFFYWLDAFFMKVVFFNDLLIWGLHRTTTGFLRPNAFFEIVGTNLVWLKRTATTAGYFIILQFLAKIFLLCSGVYVFVKLRQQRDSAWEHWRRGLYLIWLLVIPLILFLLSPQSMQYSNLYYRHVIFATVPFILLVGFVMARIPWKATVLGISILLISLLPYVLEVTANDELSDPQFQLRSIGAYINANWRPGDLVLDSGGIARTDLAHFLRPGIDPLSFLPINYYGLDYWNSRETLGFVENEFQTRFSFPTERATYAKLDNLLTMYHPKRVWLFYFSKHDFFYVHRWFAVHNWRHGFKSVGDFFVLDMYAEADALSR